MALSKVKDPRVKPDDPNSRKVKQLFLESVAVEEGYESLYNSKSSSSAGSPESALEDQASSTIPALLDAAAMPEAAAAAAAVSTVPASAAKVKRTPKRRAKASAFFGGGAESVSNQASMLLNLSMSSPRNAEVEALTNDEDGMNHLYLPTLANDLLRQSATPKEDCEAATALIALNSPTSRVAAGAFAPAPAWDEVEVVLSKPPYKRRKMDQARASAPIVTPTSTADLNMSNLTDLSCSSSSSAEMSLSLSPATFLVPRPARTRGLSVLNDVLFPSLQPQQTAAPSAEAEEREDTDTERESPLSLCSGGGGGEAVTWHPMLAAKKVRKAEVPVPVSVPALLL